MSRWPAVDHSVVAEQDHLAGSAADAEAHAASNRTSSASASSYATLLVWSAGRRMPPGGVRPTHTPTSVLYLPLYLGQEQTHVRLLPDVAATLGDDQRLLGQAARHYYGLIFAVSS